MNSKKILWGFVVLTLLNVGMAQQWRISHLNNQLTLK